MKAKEIAKGLWKFWVGSVCFTMLMFGLLLPVLVLFYGAWWVIRNF